MIRRILRTILLVAPAGKLLRRWRLSIAYYKDFLSFRAQSRKLEQRFLMSWKRRKAFLRDKTGEVRFDRHYVYHTAWSVRKIVATRPAHHVDISSTAYFAATLSAVVPVTHYDVRVLPLHLSQLTVGVADVTRLKFGDRSIASLSCLHVIEHIGLGRYGDPIDPEGDKKAIRELVRVLAPGGNLLVVVPIGTPSVVFNAHRIYSYDQIRKYFLPLGIREFALVPDDPADGGIVVDPRNELLAKQQYGCGCFWFVNGQR